MGLIVLCFFFLCVGYVAWCGRIVGPDPSELPMGGADEAEREPQR
jgi:hypothetical protein